MLVLGSCLALNLNYSGCCKLSLSPQCNNNGCYCDEHCYNWDDCCSDITDIDCYYPASSSISTVFTTPTDTLGKTIFLISCHH